MGLTICDRGRVVIFSRCLVRGFSAPAGVSPQPFDFIRLPVYGEFPHGKTIIARTAWLCRFGADRPFVDDEFHPATARLNPVRRQVVHKAAELPLPGASLRDLVNSVGKGISAV